MERPCPEHRGPFWQGDADSYDRDSVTAVDVLAHPDVFGLASPRIKVQTKNQKSPA